MKLIGVILVAGLLAVGCSRPQVVPPNSGAVDIIDYDANLILQPAHAFAARITAAAQSTDPAIHIDLSPAQQNVLLDLNKALNIADPLEQAYHEHPNQDLGLQLQSKTKLVDQKLASAQSIITITTK